MKKIVLTTIAVMLAIFIQAQTCKISSVNGKKVIQISVNLDSLSGKTLFTSINNIKDSVVLSMEFEEENTEVQPIITKVPCEDSSKEETAENIEEVAKDETVAEDIEEVDSVNSVVSKPSLTQSLLNTFGLGEIGNLVDAITTTNGEPYAEYLAKKLTTADSTKYIPQYPKRKWKWLENYNSSLHLRLSGIFGKDFGKENEEEDDIDSEDYGADPQKAYNVGGSAELSQVFIYGKYDENGNFIPNKLNFGWSVGVLFALDHQKDYGWSWDLLTKIGIQGGNGITLGADLLAGTGASPYAIYSTNKVDHRVVFHDQLCFKYGAQGWLSMNYGGNTYTTIFARIIKSVPPVSVYDNPTAKGWTNTCVDFDDGSWQVGFAVGYKFGYNTDIKSKRMQSTVSGGYNLFGADKSYVVLYELERVNNVSPTINFTYGLGYEQSLGEKKLTSLTLGGGWLFKLKKEQKFFYLAKIYAGVGEYMVTKECYSDNQEFIMTKTDVRQLCIKGGLHLGCAYRFACSTINLGLRGGYHHGLDTEYEGYHTAESSNLSGFELTPLLGYSLNF